MGLRILTVAWMQKESLLGIVSENWTHIFESRKSEKPCMDYWANKIGKIAIKHVQNTFGQFGIDLGHFWNFEFFWFFRKLSMNPWNNEQKNFSKKIAPRHVWTLGNDFRHFWNFERFWFFSLTISKSLPQKNSGKLNSNFLSPENWTHIFTFGNLNSIF